MKQNKFSSLLKYEFVSAMKNFFTPIFGILYPVVMASFLVRVVPANVPQEQQQLVLTSIIITMSIIAPLSIMLVSFPSSFAQEVENKILFRLNLYGIQNKSVILTKLFVHYLILTISLLLYGFVMYFTTDMLIPHWSSLLILILCIYALATILFVFSFSIATVMKKFGTTYAITMILFFSIMMLSGMMGVTPDKLPSAAKAVSFTLPTAYISTDFIKFWETGFATYNFAPLIQSFIFIAAIAIIVYLSSLALNKRKINSN